MKNAEEGNSAAEPYCHAWPDTSVVVRRAPVKNSEEANSVAELYCQVGPASVALRARLDLFEQLLSEPFYDTLRTKEQLGYSVHCSPRLTHGILGFAFVVISGGHGISPPLCVVMKSCTSQCHDGSMPPQRSKLSILAAFMRLGMWVT